MEFSVFSHGISGLQTEKAMFCASANFIVAYMGMDQYLLIPFLGG